MKQLRVLFLTVFAITALSAVSAAVASAENTLPTILWLPGTEEVTTKGSIGNGTTVVGQFNSTFATITAKKITVTLTAKSATQMTSLGTALILFEQSELSGSTCSTEGDAAGVVLIKAEWHTVLDLTGGGPYVLILITPEQLVSCTNGIKFKVKGSVLNKASPFKTGEVTAFTSKTECETAGSRKAKWKEYDSDTTMATAKLEANAGLGFEEVCEEAKEEMKLTATSMQEIMEP